MSPAALKIYVDFDGTVTKQDVGNAFFREFGSPECTDIIRKYRTGNLTAVECFRAEAAEVKYLDEEISLEFLRKQLIDESFHEFVAFCREHRLDFHILSDGLDYYISRILAANGIENIPFFANTARLLNGRLILEFPHTDAECSRCACCKRNIMLTRSGDDDIIVYVGEGYSDRCPVRYADVVFAKGELQAFCQQENISYFLYDSFRDIVARLRQLLKKKRIHKRLAAEHQRRAAFMME